MEHSQGAAYKIKCCDCQATFIGKNGRNLSTRLIKRKRATQNGNVNSHCLKTKHQIEWDSDRPPLLSILQTTKKVGLLT